MSDAGKIILLSSTAPGNWTTGGRFVQQMLHTFGRQNLALVLFNCNEYVAPPGLAAFNLALPRSHRLPENEMPPTKAEETVYWLFRQHFFQRLNSDIAMVSAFAARNQILHMVAILDHPAVIWIAKKLADVLNVKYSTFTGVLPEVTLRQEGYDSRSRLQVLKRYADTIKGAYATGFPSLSMALDCEAKYSVKGIEIGLPYDHYELNPRSADSAATVKIGSLLNVKYLALTQSLIAALQQISWKTSDKTISLRLIGSVSGVPFNFTGKPADVEILGGLSDQETVQSLSECTFNFLPHWTEQQFPDTARLCLPDEFPFYAAAQRPILSVCAKDSMICTIVRNFSLGKDIVSLSEQTLISALESLVDADRREISRKGFTRLRQEQYPQDLFNQRISAIFPSFHLEKISNV